MVRIAIVGMGNIGNNHARVYKANKHAKIVAVCDIIKEKADKAARDYGAQAFYSVKEMLKSGVKIDAASMATKGEENGGDHYKPTMELLKGGIPTLGEKPISNSIPQARRMVKLAREMKLPYGVNLNHRFTPAAELARKWVDDGRLGEPNLLNFRMWINNPAETSPWFHMRALHPHSFDVMRYFAGDVKKVQAFFKKGKGRKIWSNAQVNLQFENGVIGHLTGSYDAGGSYGLEICEMVGSEGRFIIEEACKKVTFFPRRSVETESYENLGGMTVWNQTFTTRIGAWVDDIRKKTPHDKIAAPGEDALRSQLIIEACIKSWETGKIVTVRY